MTASAGLLRPLRPESESLLHLDALRFIASAGIIVHHFKEKLAPGPFASAFLNGTQSLFLFVDLFFVVSGVVIAFVYLDRLRSWNDYLAFLQKRIARLGPLHWATLAVMVVVGLAATRGLFHPNHPEVFGMMCIPVNALFLHATGLCPHPSFNVPSWSISAEFFMYLLAPAYFFIGRRSLMAVGLFALASFGALTLYASTTSHWVNWTWDGGAVRAIPSFAFGVFLFLARDSVSKVPWARTLVWVALCAFFVGCAFQVSDYLLLIVLYATVLFAVAADCSDVSQKRSAPAFLRTLAAGGQLTYSSYMLHDVVLIVFVTFIGERLLHVSGNAENAFVIGAFLLIWPLSYLSLMLFERPLRKAVSSIGQKKRRDANTVSDEAW